RPATDDEWAALRNRAVEQLRDTLQVRLDAIDPDDRIRVAFDGEQLLLSGPVDLLDAVAPLDMAPVLSVARSLPGDEAWAMFEPALVQPGTALTDTGVLEFDPGTDSRAPCDVAREWLPDTQVSVTGWVGFEDARNKDQQPICKLWLRSEPPDFPRLAVT